MATLLELNNTFENKLDLFEGSHNNEKKIEANTYIYNELHNRLSKFRISFSILQLILSLDSIEYNLEAIDDSLKDLMESVKGSLNAYNVKWNTEQHLSQQSIELSDFTKLVTKVTSELTTYNEIQWQKWIDNLEEQFQVEEVLLEQQSLTGNKLIFDEYQSGLSKFNSLKNLEISESLIENFVKEKNNLVSIRGDMDFTELDEDVSTFLKQLNGRFNAPTPLSLVTPKVFQWLTDNDMLASLIVKRK